MLKAKRKQGCGVIKNGLRFVDMMILCHAGLAATAVKSIKIVGIFKLELSAPELITPVY